MRLYRFLALSCFSAAAILSCKTRNFGSNVTGTGNNSIELGEFHSLSQPIAWENPTYKKCKDAGHPKAHPHMQFVPEGLTLLDGTEDVISNDGKGKAIAPIRLGRKTATFDPKKKTAIFVLGYDGSGRSYDFFETKLWNKEFNTFVFRWQCEAFTEDLIADDVFESTDNARMLLKSELARLQKKFTDAAASENTKFNTVNSAYVNEIRFISISMGGPLVMDLLGESDPFPSPLGFNTSVGHFADMKEGAKFERRYDLLDPAFLFAAIRAGQVRGRDGQVIAPAKYDELARQVARAEKNGYAITAFTSAYAQIITDKLNLYMTVQRMSENWLADDYKKLLEGGNIGVNLVYDPDRSQFEYQHVAMVPAYFESLKTEIQPKAVGLKSSPQAITAKTPTSWLRKHEPYMKQTAGAGTLTFADDVFTVVDDPCPVSGFVYDYSTVENPMMPKRTYWNVLKDCF